MARRRRLRRQHQRGRRRRRRRRDRDVGRTTARPTSCSPTRKQPSSRRGASRRRRRRRCAATTRRSCGGRAKRSCAWGRSASRTRPTRKNNGMILASAAAGIVAHRLGARRDLRGRRARAHRATPTRRKAALDFFLNARPVGGYASYDEATPDYRISLDALLRQRRGRVPTGTRRARTPRPTAGASCLWAARAYVEASGDIGVAVVADVASGTVVRRHAAAVAGAARGRTSRPSGSCAPTRRSGKCTSRASTTRSRRWPRRAASATWRRSRRRRARTPTSRTSRPCRRR